MGDLVRRVEEIDARWMGSVLGAEVEAVGVEAIGTGQLGSVFRVTPAYAAGVTGPRTVIVKLASTDAGARQQGMALGVYETETRFYAKIAPRITMAVPACHLAEVDPQSGWFTLVFEDLGGRAVVGDVLAGGTLEQAQAAVDALVGLQAPLWNEPELEEEAWLASPDATVALFASFTGQVEPFLDRFGGLLEPAQADLIRRALPRAVDWVRSWSGPRVVQHGDYRLDNMLFGAAPDAPMVTVVDWQTARLGPPLLDLGYYLGACLATEDRRRHERSLIERYHEGLVAGGVSDFSLEDTLADYRATSLYGLYLAVGMALRVKQTDRGDAMFAAATRQYADLALDHDAGAVLA
jgi:aminoglycoside phosphotransferase (APT) family kinase protein